MNMKVATQVKAIKIGKDSVMKIRVILECAEGTKFGHAFVPYGTFKHNETQSLANAVFSIWAGINFRHGEMNCHGDVTPFVKQDEFIRAATAAYGRFPEDSDTPSEDSWVPVGSRVTEGDKKFTDDLCAELRAEGHMPTLTFSGTNTMEMAVVKLGLEAAYYVFLFEDTKLAPAGISQTMPCSVADIESTVADALAADGADTTKLKGTYLIGPTEHKLGQRLGYMVHIMEQKAAK